MPFRRASSFSFVSRVAGDSFAPSTATGSPRSKSTVMTVGVSGASSGEMVREYT